MSVKDRLAELGITLPPYNPAAANYVLGALSGRLFFTAGQTAKIGGKLIYSGKVSSVEEGRLAARLCALNCLNILHNYCGGLDNIKRIVKVTGYVNSTSDFKQVSQVIDGASDLFVDVFGDAGRHARSAIGVAQLPNDAMCEVEIIVELINPELAE